MLLVFLGSTKISAGLGSRSSTAARIGFEGGAKKVIDIRPLEHRQTAVTESGWNDVTLAKRHVFIDLQNWALEMLDCQATLFECPGIQPSICFFQFVGCHAVLSQIPRQLAAEAVR